MRSIRWIVASAMMALVMAVVAGAGAVTERNARRALASEMAAALQLQARQVALVGADALLTETPEWTLLPLAKQILERQPQIAFVVVTDRDGVIHGDSDVRRLGTPFTPPAAVAEFPDAPEPLAGESIGANRDLVVVSAPIADSDGRSIGTAWVGLRRSAIARRLDQTRREQAVVLLGFMLLGVAAALIVSSLLLRPVAALRAGLERIGSGDLEARLDVLDHTEIGALAETVNRMAGQLQQAQRELVHRERIAHEMELAQRLQKSLLPAHRRLAGPFVIEGSQEPATEVGGDYFQMLDLPGDRVGLAVADVAGKGLGGSLVTMMLHALLRALAPAHRSPAELLAVLDRMIGGMLERGSFVTLFYGILDPGTGELVFASAGHNPLLVLRHGAARPEWLRGPGAPLGIVRGSRARPRYEDVRLQLGPGDLAIQYTDGVTEALGPDAAAEFGAERLLAAAAPAVSRGSRAVIDALSRAVAEWRGGAARSDDETVLVIGRVREADTGSHASSAEGVALVARGEHHGVRLSLPASLPALRRIDDWLVHATPARHLGASGLNALRLALHEAAANVVEHACGNDATQRFDLWWVPDLDARRDLEGPQHLGAGFFLLRDRGAAFNADDWKPANLSDSEVRRRGRGLGMEILRRTASTMKYYPATPEGNLVCMKFEPSTLGREVAA